MGARAVRVDDRDIELSDPVNRSFQLSFKSRTSLPLAASKVLATEHSMGGRDGQSVAEKPLLQAQGHIFDFTIHRRRPLSCRSSSNSLS
jgi:hypothetical protein